MKPEIFRKISSLSKDFQTGLLENCHERTTQHPVTDKNNNTRKKYQEKEPKLCEDKRPRHSLGYMAMAGGQNGHAGRIVIVKGTGQKRSAGASGKGNRIMTRNILCLIVLATLAAEVALNAQPTPSANRTSSKNTKKIESQKPPAKTDAAPKMIPAPPLVEGWNYVKGEWIHSDGYKYVNGQVVRTGAQTRKRPPKPPSKSLLNSVKIKPAPTPAPNSAAAKAAEIERNKRPRPAPQTGTNL